MPGTEPCAVGKTMAKVDMVSALSLQSSWQTQLKRLLPSITNVIQDVLSIQRHLALSSRSENTSVFHC